MNRESKYLSEVIEDTLIERAEYLQHVADHRRIVAVEKVRRGSVGRRAGK